LAGYLRRTQASATEESLQRERQKALRAPMIVVVAAICNPSAKVPVIEQVLSAGAAGQNNKLPGHALRVHAMWKKGARAYAEDVKAALGLEQKDAIVGFMYLGTEAAGSAGGTVASKWQDLVQRWGE